MDDPFDGFGIAESYTSRRSFQPPRRNTIAASQARRIALPVPAIIEDHRAGLSLRSIAAKHGVSWDTIRRRLFAAGERE
jgi:hypothetical protein